MNSENFVVSGQGLSGRQRGVKRLDVCMQGRYGGYFVYLGAHGTTERQGRARAACMTICVEVSTRGS